MSLPSIRSHSVETADVKEKTCGIPYQQRERSQSDDLVLSCKKRTKSLDVLPPAAWCDEFVATGFGTPDSRFANLSPMRAGRWSEEETRYAIRLLHDFCVGHIKTPYRRYLKNVVCKELHSAPLRVFKKIRGHRILGNTTFSDEFGDPNRSKRVALWETVSFNGLEDLQRQAMEGDRQELRSKFLQRIAIDVYGNIRRDRVMSY